MSDIIKAVAAESELADLILANAANWATRADRDRFDLFPFYCVLASTGWNLNLDVFDPVEFWRAKNSPVDKPLNLHHNSGRIVGHIVGNICVGEDLKPIPDDTKEADLPTKLHIVTSCVMYRIWEDSAVQAEINDIIDQITKGELFVSMECLFTSFAYCLMNSKGEQKVIQRSPETASLTKFLRQYKGPGKIYGYTIGRLLQNITFSGVGIVKKPANPDSIISDNLNLFNSLGYVNLDVNTGENNMSTKTEAAAVPHDFKVEDHPLYKNLMDKHERLAKDHADLHNRAEEMKSKLDHIHEHTMAKEKEDREKLEKEVADLKAALAEKDKELEDEKKKAEAAETEKATAATENEAMKATIEAYKKAERSAARLEQLMNADKSLSKEQAMQTVAKLEALSDEAFQTTLALVTNYAEKAPQEVTPSKVVASAVIEKDVVADINNSGVTNTDKMKTIATDVSSWWKSQKKESSK